MRKPRKDYRLEEKWEENDVKVLTLRTPGLTELKPLLVFSDYFHVIQLSPQGRSLYNQRV